MPNSKQTSDAQNRTYNEQNLNQIPETVSFASAHKPEAKKTGIISLSQLQYSSKECFGVNRPDSRAIAPSCTSRLSQSPHRIISPVLGSSMGLSNHCSDSESSSPILPLSPLSSQRGLYVIPSPMMKTAQTLNSHEKVKHQPAKTVTIASILSDQPGNNVLTDTNHKKTLHSFYACVGLQQRSNPTIKESSSASLPQWSPLYNPNQERPRYPSSNTFKTGLSATSTTVTGLDIDMLGPVSSFQPSVGAVTKP